MKTAIIFLLLIFLTISVHAQNRAVLKPSGEIIPASKTTTSRNLKQEINATKKDHATTFKDALVPKNQDGMNDTLKYYDKGHANSNFGFFGQDWFLQWFQTPYDIIIRGVGISIVEVPETNVQLEVKLVKLKWSKAEINSVGTKHLGFYQADNNGFNNITAFQDNPDRTGSWIDSSDLGLSSPFAEDIWSDSGKGIIINPVLKSWAQNYQWITLDTLEKEIIIKSGEIIGVAVRNLNPVMDSGRVGISFGTETGFPCFKFYSNGRFLPGIDYGWWSRNYVLDFALAIQYVGIDCWPIINFTKLKSTVSTEPQEVLVDIEHCLLEDIAKSKVELVYSFNNGVTNTKLQLTTTDSAGRFQIFKGFMPSVQEGTNIRYFIAYTNAAGYTIESSPCTYVVPKLGGFPTLIVFNGLTQLSGFPQSFYFGYNGATTDSSEIIKFPHDTWVYGHLAKELVDRFQNIFEITTTGPKDNNDEIIKQWLAASPTHNYLLAGDEYINGFSTWESKFYPGQFQYDILGISDFNCDINYAKNGDEKKAWGVTAIAGTELGDSLHQKVIALNNDSLKIDPTSVLGATYSNWLDGFVPAPGVIVDLTSNSVDGKDYSIGVHKYLPAGNKVAFLAFDPLSLIGAGSNPFWYGFDRVSPLVQAMRWFGADVVDVENDVPSPASFQLNQNYPNPFNPTTVISFQLSANSKVSLKVYDVLGNEVATLVNEEKPAGNYKTDFKGTNLASGVYFYTLRAGSFVQSRKMILLK